MRRTTHIRRFVAVASLAAWTLLVAGPTPARAAGCDFDIVGHPSSAGTPFDQLYGIDALSGSNIWAVGSREAAGKPFILHWNGNKWNIVPAPDKGSITELYDVTVISPSNAWAVGYYFPSSGGFERTLIEHWNGTKWWVVPSPNPLSGQSNFLKGIDAVSASNIWAVGSNGRPGSKTLILHYNGSKWVAVKGASLANGGDLQDVSAISGSNVVAMGHSGVAGDSRALIERWDGQKWTRDVVPSSAGAGADLIGVSTPSGSAQWAAGTLSGTAALKTLTMRNTGSGWQVVGSPTPGIAENISLFNDVSALSATNVWAVGEWENDKFVRRTLIAHFSNGSWHVIQSPNSGTKNNRLFGVDAVTATNVWAVGTADHNIGSAGLIEHGC